MLNERELNEKQHRCLDRIAAADPEAIVIGFLEDKMRGKGPIVQMPNGAEILVNMTGHKKKIS